MRANASIARGYSTGSSAREEPSPTRRDSARPSLPTASSLPPASTRTPPSWPTSSPTPCSGSTPLPCRAAVSLGPARGRSPLPPSSTGTSPVTSMTPNSGSSRMDNLFRQYGVGDAAAISQAVGHLTSTAREWYFNFCCQTSRYDQNRLRADWPYFCEVFLTRFATLRTTRGSDQGHRGDDSDEGGDHGALHASPGHSLHAARLAQPSALPPDLHGSPRRRHGLRRR